MFVLDLAQPADSIIGRGEDVRRVIELLGSSRLVSLLGSGGVGKTALAAEIANELEPDFAQVVVVGLADGRREGDAVRLISHAVMDEPTLDLERVAAALDAAPTLLVLDNCEHIVEDVAEALVPLLARTTTTRVLATSRRPLDLGDEVIWTVRPLSVPDQGGEADVMGAGAVQLFLERVRQAVPTFEVTPDNRDQVVDICRAADGVPLVLELAAALARTHPLAEIHRAMTERPEGLATGRRDLPEHQRSVGASLAWSRRFLGDADVDLLDRLTVFVGGFTLEAARWLDPCGTADGVARLVDHSLVAFDPALGRYRLLEVVRVEAARNLSDELRLGAEQRHHEWCLDVVDRIHAMRFDADPDNVFPAFRHEVENRCAAMRRSVAAGDRDGFQSLLGPIALWLVHYLPPDDPSQWWDNLTDDIPVEWRASIESALAFYWSHRSHHDLALEHARRACDLHDQDGDLIGQSMAEIAIGNAHLALDDRNAARDAYDRALSSALASGHPYPELVTRVSLARLDPEDPATDRHLTDGLAIARMGFGALEALIASELGVRATRAGRHADAARLIDQAIAKARTHGYGEVLGTALCAAGELAIERGDAEGARAVLDEALQVARRHSHDGLATRAQAAQAALEAMPEAPRPVDGDVEALSEREL